MAMTLADEAGRLRAEIRELEVLAGSTQGEITRLQQREDAARARFEAAKPRGGQEVIDAAEEYVTAQGRRMTMESQLAALNAKRRPLDRVLALLGERPADPDPRPAAVPPAAAAPAKLDEGRLLQAVIDTQEEERRRIARQVHDGPAQAMANVALQSEISERLFAVDPQRSRTELASLRETVNRTLQELRGFIFELRPMILDDLGLVPTLRRYFQTLTDKHGIQLELTSSGRDRRLPADDEVAVFRLIQDSLIERIERAGARSLTLDTCWSEGELEITLTSDGRELPPDAELSSGLRRSERLELLGGTFDQEASGDRTVLRMRVPVRPGGPQMIS